MLWAVPFDVARLALTGDPVEVLDSVHRRLAGFAMFDIADNGSLIYLPPQVQGFGESPPAAPQESE